jgi:hypothetical protein
MFPKHHSTKREQEIKKRGILIRFLPPDACSLFWGHEPIYGTKKGPLSVSWELPPFAL